MTTDGSKLAAALRDNLNLTVPPIAITFSRDAPAGVDPFDAPMPDATPDGRTVRVPAGCVFWFRAPDRTFSPAPPATATAPSRSMPPGFPTPHKGAPNPHAPP